MRQPLLKSAFVVVLVLTALSFAIGDVTPPAATQPAASAPSPHTVTPAAQTLLTDLQTALSNANAITMDGELRLDLDVAGQTAHDSAGFTSAYSRPGRFRHEVKNDVSIGSTGEELYIHLPDENVYVRNEANPESLELAAPYDEILQSQNPALELLIAGDVSRTLGQRYVTIDRGGEATIDGASCSTLVLTDQNGDRVEIALDPQSHLIRRVTRDLTGQFERRGAPDVRQAQAVVEYTSVQTNADLPADAFAWTTPEGAREAGSGVLPGGAVSNLVGRPAPDFTLPDLAGNDVRLSGLRGQVVLLDFWATWCGPCVTAMPGLNEIQTDFAEKDLKVLAVNLREDSEQVEGFLNSRNLTLTALLDADGNVADSYGVQGIPTTVLVDQNGTVRHVWVGAGNEVPIRAAIESLLGQ